MITEPRDFSMTYSRVASVKRLVNSRNGNPRVEVTLTSGLKARTAADEGWVYGVNWESLVGKAVSMSYRRPRKNRFIISIEEL